MNMKNKQDIIICMDEQKIIVHCTIFKSSVTTYIGNIREI